MTILHSKPWVKGNWNVLTLTETDDDVGTEGRVIERYAYTPYGEFVVLAGDSGDGQLGNVLMTSTVGNPFTHQGLPFDHEKGMYQNRHREYATSLQRFTQRDPIGHRDGLNLYAYAASSPAHRNDPSGLRLPHKVSDSECPPGWVYDPVRDQCVFVGPPSAEPDRQPSTQPVPPPPPPPAPPSTEPSTQPSESDGGFGDTVTHILRRVKYGNHCGIGRGGPEAEPPIDCTDTACQAHDNCYTSHDPPIDPLGPPCVDGRPECDCQFVQDLLACEPEYGSYEALQNSNMRKTFCIIISNCDYVCDACGVTQ